MEQKPPLNSQKGIENTEDMVFYKALRESIKNGRCNTKELLIAHQQGLITKEQYVSLLVFSNERLEKMVGVDPLTELFNRAFLEPQLDRMKKDLNHEEGDRKIEIRSIMVIYFDIKDFKQLNNTYGHAAGDKALTLLAQRLKNETKRNDMIFRVGGDEFIAVLSINDENPRTCKAIFDRIKNNINTSLSVDAQNKKVPFSVSMGFEILNKGDNTTAEELLHKADDKMYQDKRGTRK